MHKTIIVIEKVINVVNQLWLNVGKAKLKSSQCWSVALADHVPLFNLQF